MVIATVVERKKRRKINVPVQKVGRHFKHGLTASMIVLQKTADMASWVMMRGHYQMGWAEYEARLKKKQAYKEREHLRLLARHKFLETKRIGDKLMIRLTAKGWQQALRDKIRCTNEECEDGECIIVIFDVPESEKYARHVLRYVLAECGFTMLQKSVWITRKAVLRELCALLQGSNLEQWVRVLKGSEIRVGVIKRAIVRAGLRA